MLFVVSIVLLTYDFYSSLFIRFVYVYICIYIYVIGISMSEEGGKGGYFVASCSLFVSGVSGSPTLNRKP